MSTIYINNNLRFIFALALMSTAGASYGQFRAVLPGERVISVGRTLSEPTNATSRPCTGDCEKAAKAKKNKAALENTGSSILKPAGTTCSTLEAKVKELTTQLNEKTSKYTHDMRQQQQRIDRLSQMASLSAKQAKEALEKLSQQPDTTKQLQAAKAQFVEAEKKYTAQLAAMENGKAALAEALKKASAQMSAEQKKAAATIDALSAKLKKMEDTTKENTQLKASLAKSNEMVEKSAKALSATKKTADKQKEMQEKLTRYESDLDKAVNALADALKENEKLASAEKKLKAEIESLKRKQHPRKKKGSKKDAEESASDRPSNKNPRKSPSKKPSSSR